MGTFSIWHWLIVLAVVLIIFGGRGKISQIMGDFGKGLKLFKKSVKEEETPIVDPKLIKEDAQARTMDSTSTPDKKNNVSKN